MVRLGTYAWRDAFQKGALAAGVALSGWLLVIGYFWMTGSLDAAYDILVGYNLEYAGSLLDNFLAAFDPYAHPVKSLAPYLGLFLVTGGLLAFAFGPSQGGVRLLLVYLGAALIVGLITGRFFEHYYQLLLPPMAIAGAWLMATARRETLFQAVIVAIALVPILVARAAQYETPLAQLPLIKYGRYGNRSAAVCRNTTYGTIYQPDGFRGHDCLSPWVRAQRLLLDRTKSADRVCFIISLLSRFDQESRGISNVSSPT